MAQHRLDGPPASVLIAVKENAHKRQLKLPPRNVEEGWASQMTPKFRGRDVQGSVGKVVEAIEIQTFVDSWTW